MKKYSKEEHEKFLHKMGVHPDQLKNKRKPKEKYTGEKFVSKVAHIKSLCDMEGTTPKKPEKVYSGSRKLIGIATMHKSNSVPIFEDKDKIIEIAKMRR
jgi:hypothetical protein